MNYTGWVGYWFYDAASDAERAIMFSSYGLLDTAPSGGGGIIKRLIDWFWEFF